MKIKVSIALEEDLVARLDSLARVSKVSRSQVVEQMICDSIQSSEQMAKLMANPEARKLILQSFSSPGALQAVAAAMGEKLPPGVDKVVLESLEEAGQAAANAKVAELKKHKGKKP